ncbi:MAG: zinc ribbon domain-containing protein [Clostridiales bacterium]|nr:zinc ribbon domain-containing protein [Clostridiales bacterium]
MTSQRTCPTCNSVIEGDDKFCSKCGTKLEEVKEVQPQEQIQTNETIFCQECGAKTTSDQAFCLECGSKLGTGEVVATKQTEGESVPSQATSIDQVAENLKAKLDFKSLPTKKIGIIAAVIVVILLAGVLLRGGKTDKPHAMYVKDGELNFTYLSKIKPMELTSDLIDDDYGYFSHYLNNVICFSEDRRFIFYPDRVENGEATFYWRDLNKNNEKSDSAHKIDSGIDSSWVDLSKDGSKFFYIKGYEGKLYVYDRKSDSKEKLAEDVKKFHINSKGDYIIYEAIVDGETNIYEMTLKGKKGEKEKIDSASTIISVSMENKIVEYLKEDSLYIKEASKEKEKIASDIYSIVSAANDSYYFIKREEITNKLSSFVHDDLLSADNEMVEPVEPEATYPESPSAPSRYDYTTQEWVSSYWSYTYNEELGEYGYWNEVVDEDRYNEAYEEYTKEYENWQKEVEEYEALYDEYRAKYNEYQEKLSRDELREALSDEEYAITYEKYNLLYWKNGEETLVASDLAMNYNSYDYVTEWSNQVPIVIYQKNKELNNSTYKLSDLIDENGLYYYNVISDLSYKVNSEREVDEEFYLAYEETESTLDVDNAVNWTITKDSTVYYLDNYDYEDGEGDLTSVKISKGKIGKPVSIDEDVMEIALRGDKLYYFKDIRNRAGDLYLDGKMVDDDVYTGLIFSYAKGDGLLYFTDYSTSNYEGTLTYLKGNKAIDIADDVYSFLPIDDKNIIYLTDYSIDREKGDLLLYNGKKKKVTIDTDVSSIVGGFGNYTSWY